MSVVAPNFVSARLTDEDKHNYATCVEHMQRTTGLRGLSMGDIVRLMMKTYAETHNLKRV